MTKEDKDYVRRTEDAVENFLVDDSSSDENIDYNMDIGGIFSSPFDSYTSQDSSMDTSVLDMLVICLLSHFPPVNAVNCCLLFLNLYFG